MSAPADRAREALAEHEIWVWYYLHADWQWEQSRHWHEERYALAVAEALDIMRWDPDFAMYFDTASDFYAPVERRLGPRLEELKGRVREGRIKLVSGELANCRPTQVGDETYIRNLQLGRRDFESRLPPAELTLFHACDIGIGGVQMPQLLSLAGFSAYRAWRPHGPMNILGIPHQFVWQGIDGTRLLVTRGTYGRIPGPECPVVHFKDDWDAAVAWLYDGQFRDQVVLDRSPTGHVAFTQGMDDARPLRTHPGDYPFDVIGLVREWKERERIPIRLSTPVEFSEAVAGKRDRLAIVEGIIDAAEMGFNFANHGAHGLWRWRQMNDGRLVDAEAWAALARSAGYEAPSHQLRRLWRQHCTYHAHAQDFAFEEDWNGLVGAARHIAHHAQRIRTTAIRAIVSAAGGGTRTTRFVLNPNPWPVEADVEVTHACPVAGIESVQIVDEGGRSLPQQTTREFRHPRFGGSLNEVTQRIRLLLPPCGYRRVEFVETAIRHQDREPRLRPALDVVDTSALRLEYGGAALRRVIDKTSGTSYASRDGSPWPTPVFHVLDDQDWIFGGPELGRLTFEAESGEWIESGPVWHRHRSRGTVGPYGATIDTAVAAGRRELQVDIRLEGHWDRPPMTGFVALHTGVQAGGRIAVDSPFAVEAREPERDFYVHNAPSHGSLGDEGMFERLRPGVFWGRSWCDWSAREQGVTLLSVDGCSYWLREPGVFGHIAVRCVALRPGTWQERLPSSWSGSGRHAFRYALLFHDGDWRAADPQRRSYELRAPAIVARAHHPAAASLPEGKHSFLRIDGPALLSACYVEEDNVYLRMYEHEGRGGQVSIQLDWEPATAALVDLRCQPLDQRVLLEGRRLKVSLRPWQIATLRLHPAQAE